MSLELSKVIKTYVELRDKKAALVKAHNEKIAQLDAVVDKLDAWLLQHMDAAGTRTLASPEGYGTAYIQIKMRAKCNDWPSLWGHIQQTGNFDLLEKRVSSTAVAKYFEENNALPAGVDVSQEREVVVRRG